MRELKWRVLNNSKAMGLNVMELITPTLDRAIINVLSVFLEGKCLEHMSHEQVEPPNLHIRTTEFLVLIKKSQNMA